MSQQPNPNIYAQPPAAPPPTAAAPVAPQVQPPQAGAMPVGSSTTGRPVTETESLARDIKEGALSGFVGGGTTMSGELTFKAMLRVDGHLSGRVTSQDGTLIISAGGQVDADVNVAVAQINGTVNGDIIASKKIELGRVGRVTGNIQTPALVVEQGAVFEGNCRMTHMQEAKSETKPNYTPAASANGKIADAKPETPKPNAPVINTPPNNLPNNLPNNAPNNSPSVSTGAPPMPSPASPNAIPIINTAPTGNANQSVNGKSI